MIYAILCSIWQIYCAILTKLVKSPILKDRYKARGGFLKYNHFMGKITQFIREAYAEMKKVKWPTRQQTIHYTILVVVIALVTAAYIGALDYVFSGIVKSYLL